MSSQDGLRVASVIDSLGNSGGAERSLTEMAPRLRDYGVVIDIVTFKSRPNLGAELSEGGIQTHALDPGLSRSQRREALRHLFDEGAYDVVHATLADSILLTSSALGRSGTPFAVSVTNVPGMLRLSRSVRSWNRHVVEKKVGRAMRRARRVHAVSEEVARAVASRHGIVRSRIDVVRRGRDLTRLGTRSPERRARVRARLGIGMDQPVALAIARHEYQKGIDTLVKARSMMKTDAVIFVAGREGALTAGLRQLVEQAGLGNRVFLLGRRDDVPDLLAAADVFAFPSRWEGSPGSILEAMALETPIVASHIPAILELVTAGEHAVLVPPDDTSEWASALDTAFGGFDQQLVTAARLRYESSFTVEHAVKEMADFFIRAAGRTQ